MGAPSCGVAPPSLPCAIPAKSIPKEILASARRAGLQRIDLSLYSALAAEHDAITETNNSHDATCKSASNARQVGLEVGIHYVPMATTIENVEQLIRLAEYLGASRFHILALTTQGRAKPNKAYSRLLPTERLLESLRHALTKHYSLELIISSGLRQPLGVFDGVAQARKKSSFMDVDGFLYPGEGHQDRLLRSRSSILNDSSIESLAMEVELRRPNK